MLNVTDRPRCLFVTPRFGEFAGGAEALIRGLALHLHADGIVDAEIATTCALDHHTWANVLPAGSVEIDGVPVHRFEIDAPTAARIAEPPDLSADEDLLWAAGTMFSTRMTEWIRSNVDRFDAIFAAPYLFGTTLWTALTYPEKTILIPCLHDEPDAYSTTIGVALRSCRACFFNTEPERNLAERIHGRIRGHVVGYGPADPRLPVDPGAIRRNLSLPERYIAYCGRLESGKGVARLIEMVQATNTDTAGEISLVLMGTGPEAVPDDPRFIQLGFVDEETKYAVFEGAIANVNFSRLESLSIVVQESWLVGTPCIVDSQSAVLRWQVERSGGGLAVSTPSELADAIRALSEHRAAFADAGRKFTQTEYSWSAIKSRFANAWLDTVSVARVNEPR